MPRLFADCIVIVELEMFEEEIVSLSGSLQTPWSVEWSGAAPMQGRASVRKVVSGWVALEDLAPRKNLKVAAHSNNKYRGRGRSGALGTEEVLNVGLLGMRGWPCPLGTYWLPSSSP